MQDQLDTLGPKYSIETNKESKPLTYAVQEDTKRSNSSEPKLHMPLLNHVESELA